MDMLSQSHTKDQRLLAAFACLSEEEQEAVLERLEYIAFQESEPQDQLAAE